jgi:hypothetical protein
MRGVAPAVGQPEPARAPEGVRADDDLPWWPRSPASGIRPTGSSARRSTCSASCSKATDLRRILTDYGFIGHPVPQGLPDLRPCRDALRRRAARVIYQPVTIEPREITPRIIREDNYGGLH